MAERLAQEQKEEEERIQSEKQAEEKKEKQKKLIEQERMKILEAVGGEGKGPVMAKRKLMLPPKSEDQMNESDKKCRGMSLQELLDVLNDPNADEQMRNAALRTLIELYGVQILEDGNGNKILIDANGEPLTDSKGRPIKINSEMLAALGATMGEPEKLQIDPSMTERLNVLANMIMGLTEEEAKAEFNKKCMENELYSLIENIQIDVTVEPGPKEGTWNRGLYTIEIPHELSNPDL